MNVSTKFHTFIGMCKFSSHIDTTGLLRCLAGSSWGAYTSTLRTGALALV